MSALGAALHRGRARQCSNAGRGGSARVSCSFRPDSSVRRLSATSCSASRHLRCAAASAAAAPLCASFSARCCACRFLSACSAKPLTPRFGADQLRSLRGDARQCNADRSACMQCGQARIGVTLQTSLRKVPVDAVIVKVGHRARALVCMSFARVACSCDMPASSSSSPLACTVA